MNGNISIEFHQTEVGRDGSTLLATAEWAAVPRVGELVGIRLHPRDEQTTLLTVTDLSWGWRVRTRGPTPEKPDRKEVVERIPEEAVVIVTVAAGEEPSIEFQRGREAGFEFCCGVLCPMCAEDDPVTNADDGLQHSDGGECEAEALRGGGNNCGDAEPVKESPDA